MQIFMTKKSKSFRLQRHWELNLCVYFVQWKIDPFSSKGTMILCKTQKKTRYFSVYCGFRHFLPFFFLSPKTKCIE